MLNLTTLRDIADIPLKDIGDYIIEILEVGLIGGICIVIIVFLIIFIKTKNNKR